MANYGVWSKTTRKAHGVPCERCGDKTFRKTGVCKACAAFHPKYPAPANLPETYLTQCAEELARRLEVRQAALAKLFGRAA